MGSGKDFVAISIPVGLSSGSPPRYYGSLIFAPLCDHATSGIISCGRSMTDSSCRCCSFSVVAMAKYTEWHCVNQRSTINNNLVCSLLLSVGRFIYLFLSYYCISDAGPQRTRLPIPPSTTTATLSSCLRGPLPYRCNVKEGPQAGAVQCVQNSLYNV